MSLSNLIHSASERHPDQPAIADEKAAISYAQLAERVDAAAGLLRSRQVQPGEIVAVGLGHTPFWQWVFVLGALRIGAVAAALGARAHLQLRAIPGAAPHLVAPQDSRLANLPGVRAIGLSGEELQKLDGTRMVLGLPDSATADATAGLIEFGGLDTPRAMRLGANTLQARCLDLAGLYSLGGDSRVVGAPGLDAAHGAELALATWTAGGALVLAGSAEALPALLPAARVNRLVISPRGLTALTQANPRPDLTGLGCQVTVLGAPLPPALAEEAQRLFGTAPLLLLSGPESGVFSSGTAQDIAAHPGCVGRARADVVLQVVGPDARAVARGQTGLIRVQTRAAAAAYLDGVESGSGFGLRQGWYDTGLLGHVTGDGRLYVSGPAVRPRKPAPAPARDASGKERPRVWSRGELEQAVATLPGVVEVCVLSQPLPDRSTVPVIVYAGDTDDTPDVMGQRVRDVLGQGKRFHLIRVPELPKLADGGVARDQLAALLQVRVQQARAEADAGQTRH